MQKTTIEWTDFSASLLKYRDRDGRTVFGCVKTSAGCANCYAEAIALRFKKGGPFTKANMAGLTPFFDEVEAGKVLRSKKLTGKRMPHKPTCQISIAFVVS